MFLAERGVAFLWDDMGTGKTAEVVLAADKVRARRILVSCPAAVRSTWCKEFAKWQSIPREIAAINGRVRAVPADGVTVVSHDSLSEGESFARLRDGAPYDLVVFDECQFLRRFDAARTRSALSPAPEGAWSWGTRAWMLTGTPVVNSAADLWPLVYGPLGQPVAWWDWGQAFAEECRQDGQGGIRFLGLKRERELADFLRPHALRRTLAGMGIDLPPEVESDVEISVDAATLARCMADLEGWTQQRLVEALEERDELRDAAIARVRKVLGIAKIDAIVRHVMSVTWERDGLPIVVFFQHTAVREALYAALHGKGLVVSWIDGKCTPAQVKAAEEWFQAGRLSVLLVQTDAGGVGLTLHAAARSIVAELPWTGVALRQAEKRIHRIGQTRACRHDVLRASNCWLEEALGRAISTKSRAAEKLLNLIETTN